MSSLVNGIFGRDIGKSLTAFGNCDTRVKGMCCYFHNLCDPIAECVSDVKMQNLLEIANSIPKCVCPHGYEGDGKINGNGCININECEAGTARCSHNCIDLIPGFRCECNEGYKLDQDGRTCTDINECQDKHRCDHKCVNTQGSYYCSCQDGYKLLDDGKTCEDIDECQIFDSTGYSVCQYPDLCFNLEGSYACGCPNGLQPIDSKCEDLNECLTLGSDACTNSAIYDFQGRKVQSQICENLYGTHVCVCKTGTSMSDEFLQNIDKIINDFLIKSNFSNYEQQAKALLDTNSIENTLWHKILNYFADENFLKTLQLNLNQLKIYQKITKFLNSNLICNIHSECENNECENLFYCDDVDLNRKCYCANTMYEYNPKKKKCALKSDVESVFVSMNNFTTFLGTESVEAKSNLTYSKNFNYKRVIQLNENLNSAEKPEISSKNDELILNPDLNNNSKISSKKSNQVLELQQFPFSQFFIDAHNAQNIGQSQSNFLTETEANNSQNLQRKVIDKKEQLSVRLNKNHLSEIYKNFCKGPVYIFESTFFCGCPKGYMYVDTGQPGLNECMNINECELEYDICAKDSECKDMFPNFNCQCKHKLEHASSLPDKLVKNFMINTNPEIIDKVKILAKTDSFSNIIKSLFIMNYIEKPYHFKMIDWDSVNSLNIDIQANETNDLSQLIDDIRSSIYNPKIIKIYYNRCN